MKMLVTGAPGFIGAHVVRALLEDGAEVRALHLPKENLSNLDGLDVEFFPGDITNPDSMRTAVAGCKQVYHLAGLYAMWAPTQRMFWEVNVDGSFNVFRAAAEAGVEKVVYTSTIAVSGGQGLDTDATEETPFCLAETGDPYSATKFAAHRVAESFSAMGLDLTIVSPCGPIGPGDIGPTPTGQLVLMAVNQPITMVVDTLANLVDVRDVARGHILAAQKGQRGASYLLGNKNVTVAALARMAQNVVGIHRPVIKLPRFLLKPVAYGALTYANKVSRKAPLLTPSALKSSALGGRADCTKALTELGLPVRPLEDSVRDALIWWANRDGYIANKKTLRRLRNLAKE